MPCTSIYLWRFLPHLTWTMDEEDNGDEEEKGEEGEEDEDKDNVKEARRAKSWPEGSPTRNSGQTGPKTSSM